MAWGQASRRSILIPPPAAESKREKDPGNYQLACLLARSEQANNRPTKGSPERRHFPLCFPLLSWRVKRPDGLPPEQGLLPKEEERGEGAQPTGNQGQCASW
uniref:Uncharacterized protein n=1 Tax=Thermogemmatispora argillosa TaxID=2045280 RepID=A0A455T6Z6_9CHLR|nr:hypothetical protein KTA_20930 [Thermogemmatispora argillosa]